MLHTEGATVRLQSTVIAGERKTEFPLLEVVETQVLQEILFDMLPLHLGLEGMRSPLVMEAAYFAEQKLDGLNRKKGRRDGVDIPDVNHSFRVAIRLVEAGITDEETIAAALLHDTIEDSNTSVEEIENKFGATVARAVFLLSKTQFVHTEDDQPKKVPSAIYYGRMDDENEDEKVRLMVKRIKYADRIDNLASFLIMDLNAFMNQNRSVHEALLGNLQETFDYLLDDIDPQNEQLRNDLDRMYHRGMRKIDSCGIISAA